MAGIFQGDVILKEAIRLGLDDMRKNPWLIDYILSDLRDIKYLSDKYGQAQIDSFREWFFNNQIDIYMRNITDKDRPPCVTISMGTSNEKIDMKHMADLSTETVVLMPNEIGKPIPYVVKPFTITSYDQDSGAVTVDSSIDLGGVAPGMILVDPQTGNGYPIESIEPDTILIPVDSVLTATQYGIVPQYQFYKARVEHSFFQESYRLGVHSHGDPQTTVWLHSLVMTALLRYRESLLEANGFTESVVTSGPLEEDEFYTNAGGEQAFVKYITITGQVENSWIKSPRRTIESAALKEVTPTGYTGGIKILANLDTPDFIDESEQVWTTKGQNEED